MSEPIDAIRSLRNQTLVFERVMSSLTVAIGETERLTDLTPEQLSRLWSATSRLSKAALAKGKNDE